MINIVLCSGDSRLSIQGGGHYSKITFIVRPLHIKLHFLHFHTPKITCLCAKNTWFTIANAYVNISSRFSTTYFSTGGTVAPLGPPLKSPMVLCIFSGSLLFKITITQLITNIRSE